MDRFTVSLDQDLLIQFDNYIHQNGYKNRSEAVRDILRDKLESVRLQKNNQGHCVACLSYIYNHHERELSRRLTQASHDHHDLIISTLHVHLDHDNCMEVAVLHGPAGEIQQFANAVTAETGVRHGHLDAIPVERKMDGHKHSDYDHPHPHPHPHGHDSPIT